MNAWLYDVAPAANRDRKCRRDLTWVWAVVLFVVLPVVAFTVTGS